MPGVNTCEQCGTKLPRFWQRKRDTDGKLKCPGCHPDGAGSEGRPIGVHGSTPNENDIPNLCPECHNRNGMGKSECWFCGGTGSVALDDFNQWYEDNYALQGVSSLRCDACAKPIPDAGLRVTASGDWVCADGCTQHIAYSSGSAAEIGVSKDLVRGFEGRDVPDTGTPVAVYRDLSGAPKSGYPAKGSWSIKLLRNSGGPDSLVVAHTIGLRITNARPVFSEGGRQRAMETTKRFPHAYIGGNIAGYVSAGTGEEISYYPDLGTFFRKADRVPYVGGGEAFFVGGQCWISGGRFEGDPIGRSVHEGNLHTTADWQGNVLPFAPIASVFDFQEQGGPTLADTCQVCGATVTHTLRGEHFCDEHAPDDAVVLRQASKTASNKRDTFFLMDKVKWEVVAGPYDMTNPADMDASDAFREGQPNVEAVDYMALNINVDLQDPQGLVRAYEEKHIGPRRASLQVIAHDSGDGETIYHCPFCGSGQVIARSDRTVMCEFCKTAFTVQVQPERAAFPQTIDGVPQDVPGMPGDATAPAEEELAPGQVPNPFDPNAPEQPSGPVPNPFAEPEKQSQTPPQFRAYLNANGIALPEDSFLKHLAIKHGGIEAVDS